MSWCYAMLADEMFYRTNGVSFSGNYVAAKHKEKQ